MPKMEIVQVGCPVLHLPAREVATDLFGTPALEQLIEDMKETMRAAPGVGLAAPQVGIPLRIIVLEDTEAMMKRLTPEEQSEREREPFEFRAILNPALRPVAEEETTEFNEGCLSVRGLVGKVRRYRSVEVTGFDVSGAPITPCLANGWQARILQHEVDHLDGILYFQRVEPGNLKPADDVTQKDVTDGTALQQWVKDLRLTQIPR